MAVVETAASWSSGVTLTIDEVWQCHAGKVYVATGASQPTDPVDGVVLYPSDSLTVGAGSTVYHRNDGAQTAVLTRTGVAV